MCSGGKQQPIRVADVDDEFHFIVEHEVGVVCELYSCVSVVCAGSGVGDDQERAREHFVR